MVAKGTKSFDHITHVTSLKFCPICSRVLLHQFFDSNAIPLQLGFFRNPPEKVGPRLLGSSSRRISRVLHFFQKYKFQVAKIMSQIGINVVAPPSIQSLDLPRPDSPASQRSGNSHHSDTSVLLPLNAQPSIPREEREKRNLAPGAMSGSTIKHTLRRAMSTNFVASETGGTSGKHSRLEIAEPAVPGTLRRMRSLFSLPQTSEEDKAKKRAAEEEKLLEDQHMMNFQNHVYDLVGTPLVIGKLMQRKNMTENQAFSRVQDILEFRFGLDTPKDMHDKLMLLDRPEKRAAIRGQLDSLNQRQGEIMLEISSLKDGDEYFHNDLIAQLQGEAEKLEKQVWDLEGKTIMQMDKILRIAAREMQANNDGLSEQDALIAAYFSIYLRFPGKTDKEIIKTLGKVKSKEDAKTEARVNAQIKMEKKTMKNRGALPQTDISARPTQTDEDRAKFLADIQRRKQNLERSRASMEGGSTESQNDDLQAAGEDHSGMIVFSRE